MHNQLISYAITVFVGFFAVMNPIANTPIFIGLVGHMDKQAQRKIAFKATLTALIIELSFLIIGKYLFEVFGITIPAFKITGGILLFYIGFEMLDMFFHDGLIVRQVNTPDLHQVGVAHVERITAEAASHADGFETLCGKDFGFAEVVNHFQKVFFKGQGIGMGRRGFEEFFALFPNGKCVEHHLFLFGVVGQKGEKIIVEFLYPLVVQRYAFFERFLWIFVIAFQCDHQIVFEHLLCLGSLEAVDIQCLRNGHIIWEGWDIETPS